VQTQVLFASVPVAELATAVEWYSLLFGRAPDIEPNEHEVMWRVADGGWLYVIRDAERSGGGVVTIAVDDLDVSLTELADRTLVAGPVEVIGDAGRKATLVDPAGNSVALIQVNR
jgi:predicted enzyme related to lactoylglutathione lyase